MNLEIKYFLDTTKKFLVRSFKFHIIISYDNSLNKKILHVLPWFISRFLRDVFESGDEERESSLPPLLESLAKGEKNAANMVLAYEISVNDEFELDAQDNPNSVKGFND